MSPKPPIFTKPFIAVSLINLLIMIAYYMLFIISGPYAKTSFSTSPSMAGLVAGLMVLGSCIGRFSSGHLISKTSCKTMLMAGLLVYTVSMALYLVANTLPLFCVVRLISGIGVGFIGNSTGTLIADIVPPSRRGLGISYFSLSTIIALAMGPFCGIFLTQRVSFETIFILCTATGIASIILIYAMNLQNVVTECKLKTSLLSVHNYLELAVVPLSLVVLLVGFCWGNVQAFMSEYSNQINLVWAASVFFLVYGAVVFITRPLTGRIFDKHGANWIIPPSLLSLSAGLMMLGLAGESWMMLTAGALIGAGYGNFQSTGQALSLKMVDPQRYPQTTSTFFIFLDLGIGFGPYLLGFFQPLIGYSGLYFFCSGLAFIIIPIYAVVCRNATKAQQTNT